MKGISASIDELLGRGVADVLPKKAQLAALLKKKKIRLYLGVEPTGKNLHLGHTIALRKLQQFADLGHEAILVVGTGTVLAGDPSQRESARPKITKKEIEENIETWKTQAGKIVDFSKVKIQYNGDWLLKLGLAEILEIASHISAVQLLQRDMFARRIERGDTVWTHEMLYPLLQGYDSVALDVDLEIGGTDQTFNMLIGRDLQRKMRGREKFVLTVPMILGLDGKTMSKSSGNTVNIADSPQDMYGKAMSLRDELIKDYFLLCTQVSIGEIESMDKELSRRDFKARLAKELVRVFHGEEEARDAEDEFARVFQKQQTPADIPEIAGLVGHSLIDALVKAGFASSKGEARRLVAQGGVSVDGAIQQDPLRALHEKGLVVQVGKRRFLKTK